MDSIDSIILGTQDDLDQLWTDLEELWAEAKYVDPSYFLTPAQLAQATEQFFAGAGWHEACANAVAGR